MIFTASLDEICNASFVKIGWCIFEWLDKKISLVLDSRVILIWPFTSHDLSLTVSSTLLENAWTHFDETCNAYCSVFHLMTKWKSILWKLYLRRYFKTREIYHWMNDPCKSQNIFSSITSKKLILAVSFDEILSTITDTFLWTIHLFRFFTNF